MNGPEMREARRKLGLSTRELGALLELSGKPASVERSVHRWEAGSRAIPVRAQLILSIAILPGGVDLLRSLKATQAKK